MNAITKPPVAEFDPNPRATIGGNMPPEPTPFELAEAEVYKLYDEAALWLDGAAVDSQELADDIANLMNMLRTAEKAADAARKAEKEPHLEAGRAVDAQYKPLLDKAKLATDACKKALAPWLTKLEAEKRAAEAEARRVADEKRAAAEAAIRARDAANLEQTAAAEALLKDAKKAEAAASRAEKATAGAGGSVGRKAGLRTVWTATMTNSAEALKHYKAAKPDALKAFLLSLAEADVRAGVRSIPGFSVTDEQKVV